MTLSLPWVGPAPPRGRGQGAPPGTPSPATGQVAEGHGVVGGPPSFQVNPFKQPSLLEGKGTYHRESQHMQRRHQDPPGPNPHFRDTPPAPHQKRKTSRTARCSRPGDLQLRVPWQLRPPRRGR